MAVNIQRGRDHGLPDYNTARVEFGLKRYENWTEIHPSCNTPKKIETEDDCRVRPLACVFLAFNARWE